LIQENNNNFFKPDQLSKSNKKNIIELFMFFLKDYFLQKHHQNRLNNGLPSYLKKQK